MSITPNQPDQLPGTAAPAAKQAQSTRNVTSVVSVIVMGIVSVIAVLSAIGSTLPPEHDEEDHYGGYEDDDTVFYDSGECNVMGIALRGDMYTYLPPADPNLPRPDATSSEDVVSQLRRAEDIEGVKAVLLEIDSYGGSPVAAAEVAEAMRRSSKPTLALIRGAGDSAAYWAATGADTIMAGANSDVGSIGVTSSFLDNVEKNKLEGYTYNEITTGKFKDMFSPDRVLTEEERALVMRDLNIILENFITDVAEGRNLDTEKVRALADGSTMLGAAAKENGLIDEIGSLYDAEDFLTKEIGEDASVCW